MVAFCYTNMQIKLKLLPLKLKIESRRQVLIIRYNRQNKRHQKRVFLSPVPSLLDFPPGAIITLMYITRKYRIVPEI